MDRRKRIEYLILTWSVFISVFMLFYFLGKIDAGTEFSSKEGMRVFSGLAGGYICSSVFSGILLAARYFSKRTLTFKIVAALLSIFTFFVIYVIGIITFVPYQIYNLIMIARIKPRA